MAAAYQFSTQLLLAAEQQRSLRGQLLNLIQQHLQQYPAQMYFVSAVASPAASGHIEALQGPNLAWRVEYDDSDSETLENLATDELGQICDKLARFYQDGGAYADQVFDKDRSE